MTQEQELHHFGPSADELEAFEEKANDLLERFLESMQGDLKYLTPVDKDHEDYSMAEEEGWAFVYTQKGDRLATRMIDRLCKLADKKFGASAIDITIESHLYREG
jgi:hypothetical protein